jgi:hypothetical protein
LEKATEFSEETNESDGDPSKTGNAFSQKKN